MEEAKKEFSRIVTDNAMQDAIVLILANKQDQPKALSAEELAEFFDLENTASGRPGAVRACCAKDGSGLEDAMDWMAGAIINKRKTNKKKK